MKEGRILEQVMSLLTLQAQLTMLMGIGMLLHRIGMVEESGK